MDKASKTPIQKPIDIAKKQWTPPTVEIIANDNIQSGHNSAYSEAYLRNSGQPSTVTKNFIS